MSDPTMRRFSAKLSYTASDKYRSESGIASNSGKSMPAISPRQALLESARELARIGALFGFETEVRAAMEDAFKAVSDWRATR